MKLVSALVTTYIRLSTNLILLFHLVKLVVMQCWQIFSWATSETEVCNLLPPNPSMFCMTIVIKSCFPQSVNHFPISAVVIIWLILLLLYHCRAFFGSLYRCLARGARAVLQVYPENLAQRELILGFAMRAGFSGGVVVDYPHRYVKRYERGTLFIC